MASALHSSRNSTTSTSLSPAHRSPPSARIDPRELARNASLNALTGGSSHRRSTPSNLRHISSSASSNAPSMDSEQSGPVEVGDTVEVPGGMTGVVKYVGNVKGKNGVFAGVELHRDFAARGKNDGDVEGTKYFTTSVPGAGIFLPLHRAVKQESPTLSASTFPPTPTTPGFSNFDLNKPVNGVSRTPPTPSVSKLSQSIGPGSRPNFSQSVGPGIRASSPQLKKPRQSLPRPESPLRKPPPPSLQPTPGKGLSASVRGSRPTLGATPSRIGPGRPSQTPNVPRAASRSQSRQDSRQSFGDDTPTQQRRPSAAPRASFLDEQPAPADVDDTANAEIGRLKHNLDERDRQLRDQASSLAEMETSLAELQSLVALNASSRNSPPAGLNGDDANPDVAQLRAMLREKNEKIQLLTSEFDSHRADFRNTIDALEMASTETERVYEKRVQELLQENADLSEGGNDVETLALQLKQLEDFVAELEDGLEDARRGEAEARSEVEFLRGEVERSRTELRREREKAAKALKGATGAMNDQVTGSRNSRELEQRDDEIRGLKAIIHSLSSGSDMASATPEKSKAFNAADKEELSKLKSAVAELQREKGELQGMIERKSFREEELEREVTRLKLESPPQPTMSGSAHNYNNSVASVRTAIRPSSTEDAAAKKSESRPTSGRVMHFRPSSRPGTSGGDPLLSPSSATFHDASQTLADSPSLAGDTASSVAEPYCDFCDSADHDILSCSAINGATPKPKNLELPNSSSAHAVPPLRVKKSNQSLISNKNEEEKKPAEADATASAGNVSEIKDSNGGKLELKDFPEGTPAPGKSTGAIDMAKWCAMCEHEGHESIDCPFEEDY